MNQRLRVAISGLGSPLADALASRLLALRPRVSLVGFGMHLPSRLHGNIQFHRVDSGDDDAEKEIHRFLAEQSIEVVAHLPFEPCPGAHFEGGMGWLARSASSVANASARAHVKRLIFGSSTMCYGARAENPSFLDESRALVGHLDSPWILDQCAADEAIARTALAQPRLAVCTLRHPWVVGSHRDDPVSRYFGAAAVPIPMGRDPLLQFVHERDLLNCFERSICGEARGVYNIVANGALPVSRLLALAGKKGLPMPAALLRSAPAAPRLGPDLESPEIFFDYLRYLWIADGSRAQAQFGTPLYTTQEAWIALVSALGKTQGLNS